MVLVGPGVMRGPNSGRMLLPMLAAKAPLAMMEMPAAIAMTSREGLTAARFGARRRSCDPPRFESNRWLTAGPSA
jgi:hypothetical protein